MARKMFYTISTHLGGAERSLLGFLKSHKADTDRSDFFVLVPKSTGPLVDELIQHNIRYRVLAFPESILGLSRNAPFAGIKLKTLNPLQLKYLWTLQKVVREEDVDTIHCTGIKCHVITCLLSPWLSAKIVIHLRDFITPAPLARFFELFKGVEHIQWLACSYAVADSLPKLKPLVVYDGLDANTYYPMRGSYLKDLLKIPHEQTLIGLVGVVARWKGHKEFILAAHKVLQTLPQTHFAIIGDQIYDTHGDKNFLDELKELCHELGVSKNIHFVGFQKNTLPVYNSLDWSVHASKTPEPFGRVIAEAMLCHTPVIASNAGGVLEIVDDKITGLLHTPGDVDSLAQVMLTALGMSQEERQKMTELAYQNCRRSFSLHGGYTALKQIIEKLD